MCAGNTRDALEFLSVPGVAWSQDAVGCTGSTSNSRLPSRSGSSMLPTIEEDEELTLCSSPTSSSCSESSCSITDSTCTWGCQPAEQSPYQHQQCSDLMQTGAEQHGVHMDPEEALLAAIDLRLQQLLQLRDQRLAAIARARSAPANTAADPCCNTAGAVWAAPASAPGYCPTAGMACAEQSMPFNASAQASNEAARLAAAKVLQMQQMQRMQMVLQRELLEMLGQGY